MAYRTFVSTCTIASFLALLSTLPPATSGSIPTAQPAPAAIEHDTRSRPASSTPREPRIADDTHRLGRILHRPDTDKFRIIKPIYRPGVDKYEVHDLLLRPRIDKFEIHDLSLKSEPSVKPALDTKTKQNEAVASSSTSECDPQE